MRAIICSALLLQASWACWAQTTDPQLALGKLLFTKKAVPACAICHTLKDAGSEGEVGPVLDELKPDAKRVLTALRSGIGAMPSFKATLTEEEMAALARYVSTASNKN